MNSFTILCPSDNCSRSFDVPIAHAGKKARCPYCRTVFTIPHPGTRSARLPDEEQGPRPLEILPQDSTPQQPVEGPYAAPAQSPPSYPSAQQASTTDGGGGFGGIGSDILDSPTPSGGFESSTAKSKSPGSALSIWIGLILGVVAALGIYVGVMHNKEKAEAGAEAKSDPKPDKQPAIVLVNAEDYRDLLRKHSVPHEDTGIATLDDAIVGRRFTMRFVHAPEDTTEGRAQAVYSLGGQNFDTGLYTVNLCIDGQYVVPKGANDNLDIDLGAMVKLQNAESAVAAFASKTKPTIEGTWEIVGPQYDGKKNLVAFDTTMVGLEVAQGSTVLLTDAHLEKAMQYRPR
jgi:hypothetical protein